MAKSLTSRVMKSQAGAAETDNRRRFGQWLQEQRARSGYPVGKEFAALIGISPVQLSRIESGVSGVSPETLDKIVELLKLDAMDAYKRAGLLPDSIQREAPVEPLRDERELLASQSAEALQLLITLPPEERARMLAMMRVMSGKEIKITTPEEWIKEQEEKGRDVGEMGDN